MTGHRVKHHLARTLLAALLVFCALGALSGVAFAAPGAGWEVTANTYPTNLAPASKAIVHIRVFNIGASEASRSVVVTDTLPQGLTAFDAGQANHGEEGANTGTGTGIKLTGAWACTGSSTVTCTLAPGAEFPVLNSGAGGGKAMEINIAVKVAPGASGSAVNRVVVSGGGAPTPASTSLPIVFSSAPAGFGFTDWQAWFSNADGTIDTQAGSHPYEATFYFNLATDRGPSEVVLPGGLEINTVESALPPGLIGDPHAVPQCARVQFDSGLCPLASQIGVVAANTGLIPFSSAIYNVVPPGGVPAEFGFNILGVETFLDAGVRTGSDYAITEHVAKVAQRKILATVLTFWGYPADPSHDPLRGLENQGGSVTVVPRPFLTLPTSCSGPQAVSIRTTPWQDPSVTSAFTSLTRDAEDNPAGFTGCEHLNFNPVLKLAPDTAAADTPAGLSVDVKPPVDGLSEIEGLSTADIRNTTVTLPAGLAINPGQAAGLQACSASQSAVGTEGAPSCPSASKVGTDTIETPLLTDRMEGGVYVLQSNPPNLQLLVAASADGVNVKLVGDVHLDEATGQLTTTFSGTPELPFTDFKLAFSGGAQAALATPTLCGTYTASSDFSSWSSPFIADVFPTNSFAILTGPNGSPCSNPLPFGPQLIAGSTTDQAGGFTNFSLLLQAPDDQKRIEKLQFKVPEGLLGMISQVPLCGEPQAQSGTCSSVSQIGHTVVASGPGPYPLIVPQPGQPPAAIYLTGPYKGAPYGLSIVVPVVVGPFTLETQIVRAKIEVDPLTAQITVTTDPFPQMIDGVPTDLRTINAVIDRPGFMFNPTNCSPMSFSGTAWGTAPPGVGGPGSTAAISSHFQMGSCQALTFKPDFRVSTAGKTSRRNGASLDVKLVYPVVPTGHNQASGQSNIASVKVDLPKQLPSRLTTLQKACPSATFEANPAACSPESRVGQVTAVTPVLPVKLAGPAIFVSYGGAKFPELVFVLQGYGVTVYVHAETFINEKTGITSSTLHRVPDVPISSFELKLPQGPFSALAANGNLCKSSLKMPTAFVAQDGAVIHQSTPISVTGCAKHKTAKKAKRKAHKATRGHRTSRGKRK